MSRFKVGEKYLFGIMMVSFNIPSQDKKVVMWTHVPESYYKIRKIELLELTCLSEHAVPGEYDSEKISTGYIFKDQYDRVWHNQYPTAAYSQLSTSMDYQCQVGWEDFTAEDVEKYGFHGISYAKEIMMILVRAAKVVTDKDVLEKIREHFWDLENAIYDFGYESRFVQQEFKRTNPSLKPIPYDSVEIVKR